MNFLGLSNFQESVCVVVVVTQAGLCGNWPNIRDVQKTIRFGNKLALMNHRWPLTPTTSPGNLRLIPRRLDSSPDRGYKGLQTSDAGQGHNLCFPLVGCTRMCEEVFLLVSL